MKKERNILFLVLVACLGGFLFGYDTTVVAGCEQQIQQIFGLSGTLHGIVMSGLVWGCVVGGFCGGRLTDRLGRRMTLIACAALFFATSLTSAFAFGPWDLTVSRFFGGIAVGVASIAAPVYIAEISPPEKRGTMGGLFQINAILGMVAAQLANWGIDSLGFGASTWRWMLGAMAVPSALFLVLAPFLTESESWLKLGGSDSGPTASLREFFSRKNVLLIFLAVSISAYDQLSGINAVMFFAVRIFRMAGISEQTSLVVSASMGAIGSLGTFAGLILIDRIGRRRLLLIGLTGCIVAHFACAASFALNTGFIASACVFIFVIFYQMGQGVVLWVFLAEIFPTRFRAQGQSTGIFVNWTCAAALTMVLPIFFERCAPWLIFAFFGFCLVTMVLWVLFLMPETKGKELSE